MRPPNLPGHGHSLSVTLYLPAFGGENKKLKDFKMAKKYRNKEILKYKKMSDHNTNAWCGASIMSQDEVDALLKAMQDPACRSVDKDGKITIDITRYQRQQNNDETV